VHAREMEREETFRKELTRERACQQEAAAKQNYALEDRLRKELSAEKAAYAEELKAKERDLEQVRGLCAARSRDAGSLAGRQEATEGERGGKDGREAGKGRRNMERKSMRAREEPQAV